MKRFLGKWDAARWLRLLLGTGFVIYGLHNNDSYVIVLGILFLLMALLNWSCCAAGGCNASSDKKALYKDFVEPYEFKNKQ